MPVSGVVVTCRTDNAADVARRIALIKGIEVHGVQQDGRIVAVIEADTVHDEVALVTDLHEIDGVVSVQVAYHNFEDFGVEQP
jgi:nitrate reductase NapD